MVARFDLNGNQWDKFAKFYRENPTKILTKNDLQYDEKIPDDGSGAHAVLLIRVEPNCLVFMNSWGDTWADRGFFRVKNGNVLNMTFYDIYWTLNDLTQHEKEEFKKYSQNKSEKNCK